MAAVENEAGKVRIRARYRWLAAAAFVAVLAVLFAFDPALHRFYPQCWFHRLTGLNCPACGGLRAVHALLHGDVAAALHHNLLFVLFLPALAVYFLRRLFRRPSAHSAPHRPGRLIWPWVALAALVIFGILRNLPGPAFAWMSP